MKYSKCNIRLSYWEMKVKISKEILTKGNTLCSKDKKCQFILIHRQVFPSKILLYLNKN